MVTFDMFQRAGAANYSGESEHQLPTPSAVETQPEPAMVKPKCLSQLKKSSVESRGHRQEASGLGALDKELTPTNSEDRDILRLQSTITELKKDNKVKDVQLRSAKEELRNARETVNRTFAEYSSVREELKTVKQALGSDHQAIVYRKDIELFALRKGNEQKEKYIKECDAKLEEMHRHQTATIEVKDAQLKLLTERVSFMERQASPKFGHERKSEEDGDHALEVRLLRVRKGRRSPEIEDEKDATADKLQGDLSAASKASQVVVNQQAELQRAWDVTKKVQAALKEEREQHTQTKEQLQEMTVRLSESEVQGRDRDVSTSRLPTIDEDEQDTKELEAMFDTAQADNLRLHAEVEALEKRLREANARIFAAVRDVEALQEQVRLEKAINDDIETLRPSVVHRVHFQRMEGQLRESHNILVAKEKEIELLKSAIAEKEGYAKELKGEVDAAVCFHTQDQDEIESLKQSIIELQATNERLMLDHERLASQRARQRVAPVDRVSARSSGATLIQELSPQLTSPSDVRTTVQVTQPMPLLVESQSSESIQMTPRRHMRSESTPNPHDLMSNDVQAPEPRETKGIRRRSLVLKGFMKKIARKNREFEKSSVEKERKANQVKDKERNIFSRPKTATGPPTTIAQARFPTTTAALPESVRASKPKTKTTRYYATEEAHDNERPPSASGINEERPTSRRSWAATNKLKRRSLY